MSDTKVTVFRLVTVGKVDRVIGIENLPDEFIQDVDVVEPNGFPREWSKWLKEVGSIGKRTQGNLDKPQVTKEFPAFFALNYYGINKDKERWEQITQYVRRVSDARIRLLDKLEDMAKPFAPDSKANIDIFPEDVPIIPLPKSEKQVLVEKVKEAVASVATDDSVAQDEQQAKKRGRPRKESVVNV